MANNLYLVRSLGFTKICTPSYVIITLCLIKHSDNFIFTIIYIINYFENYVLNAIILLPFMK
jgi:hypothetical protein